MLAKTIGLQHLSKEGKRASTCFSPFVCLLAAKLAAGTPALSEIYIKYPAQVLPSPLPRSHIQHTALKLAPLKLTGCAMGDRVRVPLLPELEAELAKVSIMPGVALRAEDIANGMLYLASDMGRCVNVRAAAWTWPLCCAMCAAVCAAVVEK